MFSKGKNPLRKEASSFGSGRKSVIDELDEESYLEFIKKHRDIEDIALLRQVVPPWLLCGSYHKMKKKEPEAEKTGDDKLQFQMDDVPVSPLFCPSYDKTRENGRNKSDEKVGKDIVIDVGRLGIDK